MIGRQRSNWWVVWFVVLIFIAMIVSVSLIPWAIEFKEAYYR